MIIYWFSEIKWDYLKTRKQQILSLFPKSDVIYFIEPISKLTKNKYTIQNNNPVYNITIPQLRSVSNPLLLYIINIKSIRKCIFIISTLWFYIFKYFCHKEPDILVTSNVYWIDTIKLLINQNPQLKLIYDCNDDPLSFLTIPKSTKEYFDKTLIIANKIVLTHKSSLEIIPKMYKNKLKVINNGVDFALFQSDSKYCEELKQLKHPIIIFIGAISDWFDFSLIKSTARQLKDIQIVLIGPVAKNSKSNLVNLLIENNIKHIPTIPHNKIINYLNNADVCIIPFLKTQLTSIIFPNKMLEYSAAGKACVMTNFNKYLKEYDDILFISRNLEDFISNIKNNIISPPQEDQLKTFASKYDWKTISSTFHNFLMDIIEESAPTNNISSIDQ